ncbi:peptide chain release factor 2 [Chrysiogenes arsenatis]|uniref:peptide chain release factor 2 n=1 Tax=Chrysiogenes arsenatis TaxID=309797 RepID=UPI001268E645
MLEHHASTLNALNEKIAFFRGAFDITAKEERLAEIVPMMEDPKFWSNQELAQKILREDKMLKNALEGFRALRGRCDDAFVHYEFAQEDESFTEEFLTHLHKLEKEVQEYELTVLLSGEQDPSNAYVTINAGAGGTESQDWASMLYRMYTRWAERHKFKITILEYQEGEEAGMKSATLFIQGLYAYGYLKAETGVHRLVRISPFDSNARRHTSFASIFVSPEVDDDIEIDINESDLKIDTYRSGGAGGQHVNTTDSAVRITHMPTGLVTQCQNERSQHQNKEQAMKMLRAKLYEYELAIKTAALREVEDSKKEIGWGSQIRSYVLHPYKMVKDLRTRHESGNPDSVLDGAIDDFIKAYLQWMSTGGKTVTEFENDE